MADYPILYSFRRCPYAMRARMALRYSQVRVEHREVVLKDKPAAMLAASPKGTVPVLVLPDQRVLEESLDIMSWALAQRDESGWLAIHPEQQCDLVQRMDDQFKPALDRYKYHNHKDENFWRPARDTCASLLAELEHRLLAQQAIDSPALFGASLRYADVAIAPFVRQFANVDSDWFARQPYPQLQRWLSAFLQSALFVGVMHKFPRWEPGTTPLIIGQD